MKHKHLYSLLDTSFVLASVVFPDSPSAAKPIKQARPMGGAATRDEIGSWTVPEPAPWGQPAATGYQYKVPRAWDVKLDDFLVVNSPINGISIARVVAVDQAASIDPDADFTYKWAVQKIDFTEHTELVKREGDFQMKMLEVERTAQREEAAAKYRAHLPEGSEAMKIFNDAVAAIQGHATVDQPGE